MKHGVIHGKYEVIPGERCPARVLLALHDGANIFSLNPRDLSILFEDLPALLKVLNSERGTKTCGNRNIEWIVDSATVTLTLKCSIEDAIGKLKSLYVEIEPLLEFGMAMCEQLARCPLKSGVALHISGHREIEGLGQEQWLEIRREAGKRIDPNTAEIGRSYRRSLDPYGVLGEPPEPYRQYSMENFVRAPGSDVWIWDCHLPKAKLLALWKRLRQE
jgi:hypothetical protein